MSHGRHGAWGSDRAALVGRPQLGPIGMRDAASPYAMNCARAYLYVGSLQLFPSLKVGGTRSLPQITFPARPRALCECRVALAKIPVDCFLAFVNRPIVAVVNYCAGHPVEYQLYDIKELGTAGERRQLKLGAWATMDWRVAH